MTTTTAIAFTKAAVIRDFPGLLLTEVPLDRRCMSPDDGDDQYVPILKHGDTVGILTKTTRGDEYVRTFRVGTVIGYAQQYNEDPIAALDRARQIGDTTHWLNAMGATITADRRARPTVWQIAVGSEVIVDGARFIIENAPNSNLRLVPVA